MLLLWTRCGWGLGRDPTHSPAEAADVWRVNLGLSQKLGATSLLCSVVVPNLALLPSFVQISPLLESLSLWWWRQEGFVSLQTEDPRAGWSLQIPSPATRCDLERRQARDPSLGTHAHEGYGWPGPGIPFPVCCSFCSALGLGTVETKSAALGVWWSGIRITVRPRTLNRSSDQAWSAPPHPDFWRWDIRGSQGAMNRIECF